MVTVRDEFPGSSSERRGGLPQDKFEQTFWDNARNILKAAEAAMLAGAEVGDWSVLIGPSGGVHMVANAEWDLDSLQVHLGAPMAYRVRQAGHSVRLEGRAGARTCLFESAKPDGAARLLLATTPMYEVGLAQERRSGARLLATSYREAA